MLKLKHYLKYIFWEWLLVMLIFEERALGKTPFGGWLKSPLIAGLTTWNMWRGWPSLSQSLPWALASHSLGWPLAMMTMTLWTPAWKSMPYRRTSRRVYRRPRRLEVKWPSPPPAQKQSRFAASGHVQHPLVGFGFGAWGSLWSPIWAHWVCRCEISFIQECSASLFDLHKVIFMLCLCVPLVPSSLQMADWARLRCICLRLSLQHIALWLLSSWAFVPLFLLQWKRGGCIPCVRCV